MLRSFLRQVRRRVRALVNRDVFVNIELKRELERHGSEYGGWSIVRDSLCETSNVYSFGVGDDVSFDLSIIDRYGVTVHAFDPTPRSINWVSEQVLPAQFRFHEYGIGEKDCEVVFFAPPNPSHMSYATGRHTEGATSILAPVRRLSTIMKQLGHEHLDLLKMDIEGSEYEVLDPMVADGIAPHQLLVEFHHRFMPDGPARTRAAVALMSRYGYSVIAVSPSGEEVTFLRNRDNVSLATTAD